jgi:NAD(P)-dependent dehydrogenase (short-subunit alcohol dehydrogenase family)
MAGVVAITGAGRGIGAACALAAARAGYRVGVNYLGDAAAAAGVVGRIEADGGRAVAVRADVAQPAEVARLFDEVADALGPVGALVNNAGTTGRITRFAELDLATLRRVIDVNLIGCMLCSQEAVRRWSGGGAYLARTGRDVAPPAPSSLGPDHRHRARREPRIERSVVV